MRILVTGGAGYIGCTLVPLLLQQGHTVTVLDSLMYGGMGLLPHFRNPRFHLQVGDIRDPRAVKDAMAGCDAVIHLAAIVGFPACRKSPDLAQTVNVDGTKVVAAEAGRSRLVLLGSTGSNYGTLEDDICTEETPLNPLSLYGRTKTEAERWLMEHCETIAFRFATAFGVSPRMRLDLLVNDFVFTAMSLRYLVVYESHFMRSFIHVHDMARSFAFALENADRMRGQVFNAGSESMNYSKQQVCEMIRARVEYYLHFADVGEDADKRNYVVSYKKLHALGYDTTVTLDEGIDELIRAAPALDVPKPYSNV